MCDILACEWHLQPVRSTLCAGVDCSSTLGVNTPTWTLHSTPRARETPRHNKRWCMQLMHTARAVQHAVPRAYSSQSHALHLHHARRGFTKAEVQCANPNARTWRASCVHPSPPRARLVLPPSVPRCLTNDDVFAQDAATSVPPMALPRRASLHYLLTVHGTAACSCSATYLVSD